MADISAISRAGQPERIFEAVNIGIGKWLDLVADAAVRHGRRSKKSKRHRIRVQRSKTNKVDIHVNGQYARMAIDYEIQVPVGGFKPRSAKAFWFKDKPEGEKERFRARTYSKYSGQRIRVRGYMSLSAEKVLGRRNMDLFAASIGSQIGLSVAFGIAKDLREAGFIVNITPGKAGLKPMRVSLV